MNSLHRSSVFVRRQGAPRDEGRLANILECSKWSQDASKNKHSLDALIYVGFLRSDISLISHAPFARLRVCSGSRPVSTIPALLRFTLHGRQHGRSWRHQGVYRARRNVLVSIPPHIHQAKKILSLEKSIVSRSTGEGWACAYSSNVTEVMLYYRSMLSIADHDCEIHCDIR